MYRLLHHLDAILNRYTMYKVLLYGLRALFVVAVALAATGAIGVSATGLLVSALTFATSCYLANLVFSRYFKAPTNKESWTITALILVFTVTPRPTVHFVLLAVLTGILAMASKYLITSRGSHLLNPAAAGAVIVSVTGLMGFSWWVATPWLAPFTGLLALVILRKQRKFTLFVAFSVTAVLTLLASNLLNGQLQTTAEVLRAAVLSWPIIFLGSIMLTEPLTLPKERYYQILMAVIVGLIFGSQQHVGPLTSSPHVALIFGNIFAAVVSPPFGAMLKLTRSRQLAADITELTFARPKRLQFKAGQYLEWTLPHDHPDRRGNRRAFSIASAPNENDLRIAVRTYEKGSTFKRALTALEPGASLRASNLDGDFMLPGGNGPVALIAGGIGITPFRSQLVEHIAQKRQRDFVVLYIASDAEHFVYRDELEAAKKYGVHTEYLVGRIDGSELPDLIPDIMQRQVLISGPDAMVRDFRRALLKHGLSRNQIRTDHFSGY